MNREYGMARILVVEDSPDNRELLVHIFQRFGHETLVSADGAEGVALAQQQMPDAIVMDLIMPKLNGWEAVRQLKADTRTARIPILAVTALHDAEQRACRRLRCVSDQTVSPGSPVEGAGFTARAQLRGWR
jgi:twitching motility two-component system response regulator PilH